MDWRRSVGKMLFVFVAMTSLAVPGMAHAQEEAAATQLDRNLDKYWGEKREIRTIEKRLFRKDTRLQASLYGGIIPNDDFQLFTVWCCDCKQFARPHTIWHCDCHGCDLT